MPENMQRFLHDTGMHWSRVEYRDSLAAFTLEMRRGLAGEPSSLLMLPTFIRADSRVPRDREIVVMDAGGTNFRVATVSFGADGPAVGYFDKSPMPGTGERLSREEFYDAIARRLLPVADRGDTVGFCFSYPTEILPNRDGRLLRFSKEVRADGVEGDLIGAGINEALRRHGAAPKTFVLLNDTVATMLGGIAVSQDKAYGSFIGYILGTGTNTCYLEQSERITKSPQAAALGGAMAVNMESGGYAHFPRGDIDLELDQSTRNPGSHLMEKMISGAYQGTLIHRTVQRAAEKGLFSAAFSRRLQELDSFSMYDIDRFCYYPFGQNRLADLCRGSEADAHALYDIIDASFERAARMTAVTFAAILTHTGTGTSPLRPVCITAEGTTFTKSKLLRPKLDHYLRTWLEQQSGLYCEYIQVADATLVGTAVAALLNTPDGGRP